MADDHRLETPVAATVVEKPIVALADDTRPHREFAHAHRGEHLAREIGIQHLARLCRTGPLQFDHEACEIRGRGPQAGRRLFGVDMPGRVHSLARCVVGTCIARRIALRSVEAAMLHCQRTQHQSLHQALKPLAGRVAQRLLHDQYATAGVARGFVGRLVEPDRAQDGRRLSFDLLFERRQSRPRRVARKTEAIRGARRVAEEAARCDRRPVLAGGPHQFPAAQQAVYIQVEIDPFVLRKPHRSHRSDRLADRCRLEPRVRVHCRAARRVGNAICLDPIDPEIADHGDAHSRHVQPAHRLDQSFGRPAFRLARDGNVRAFHRLDARGDIALGDGRRGQPKAQRDQRGFRRKAADSHSR
jgi:hypothetical protein